MSDIELVIKIDEDIYKSRKQKVNNPKRMVDEIELAIANGTPLPKGHGKLKDSELLDKRLRFLLNHAGGYKNTPIGTGIVIAIAENLDAKTIIEADKAESEG